MPLIALAFVMWQAAAPAPARVFVTTNPRGPASDVRDRTQSVKDLHDAFAKKKKDLTLVEDADIADVVVDVAARTVTMPKIVIGMARPGLPGAGASGPAYDVHLRVVVRHGAGDPIEFANKNTVLESGGGWQSAAEDVAKQIEKWIADLGK